MKRGADGASDHHLLIAKLRLKLKRHQKTAVLRTRYNTELLKDPNTLQDFQLEIRNIFQALQEIYEEGTSCVNKI